MAISKWHEAKTWPTKRMDHDLPTSTTWNKQGNIINNINITDEKTLQNIKNISSKKKKKEKSGFRNRLQAAEWNPHSPASSANPHLPAAPSNAAAVAPADPAGSTPGDVGKMRHQNTANILGCSLVVICFCVGLYITILTASLVSSY